MVHPGNFHNLFPPETAMICVQLDCVQFKTADLFRSRLGRPFLWSDSDRLNLSLNLIPPARVQIGVRVYLLSNNS